MAKSWICPFCNQWATVRQHDDYKISILEDWSEIDGKNYSWEMTVTTCPSSTCGQKEVCVNKYIGELFGHWDRSQVFKRTLEPEVDIRTFPDYIPAQIIQDYKEAKLILQLSPKSSATLARRCLQSMIRDFHKIINKSSLHKEIQAIEDKIDPDLYEAIMALKSIGNIGAHPEQDINLIIDIEPEEANQLVELIEMLLEDWYVERERRNNRIKKIQDLNNRKQVERKEGSNL